MHRVPGICGRTRNKSAARGATANGDRQEKRQNIDGPSIFSSRPPIVVGANSCQPNKLSLSYDFFRAINDDRVAFKGLSRVSRNPKPRIQHKWNRGFTLDKIIENK